MVMVTRMSVFVVCLALLCAVCCVRGTEYYMISSMNGAQDGVSTPAIGVGVLMYDSSSQLLSYKIYHNVSNTVTMAHIHGPASTTATAGILFTLQINGQGPIVGNVSMTSNAAATIADLAAGLWYFNIHTTVFTAGEIRGQILAPSNTWVATLNGAQELASPPVFTTAAGVGWVTFNGASATVFSFALAHNVIGSTMSHIHGPCGATTSCGISYVVSSSSVAAALPYDVTSVPVSASSPALTYSNFQNGQYYFNVHSTANPNGEIRGNLLNLAAFPSTSNPSSAKLHSLGLSGLALLLTSAFVLFA
eukprot:ANDGO_01647.mRNA.1 CHRD domain superfamily protein